MPKLLYCQRSIVTKHFRKLSCLSRVVGYIFKEKSRFKNSKSSHRCSNANAKFQFQIQLGVLVLRNTDNSSPLYDTHTCTYHVIKPIKSQKYLFPHCNAWEKLLVSGCFLKRLERQNENYKSMTQNHLKEKKKFRVIMKEEKLLQNLYLRSRSTTTTFLSQQNCYIETLQAIEILLLKALREEDFGHEL